MLYCCTYKSKQSVYRHFRSDKQAVKAFSLMGVVRYDNVSDISKKLNDGTWSRVAIRREWLF